MKYVSLLLHFLFLTPPIATTFEWSFNTARPHVDRRSIAGIWKVTPVPSMIIPMKEFTVYPPKQQQQTPTIIQQDGFLLMLKEDGSFQQYTMTNDDDDSNDDDDDEETNVEGAPQLADITTSWNKFQEKLKEKQARMKLGATTNIEHQKHFKTLLKGIWDYREGKLILAADRPEINRNLATTTSTTKIASSSSIPKGNSGTVATGGGAVIETKDTLLEGKVVATYQTRLEDNPIVSMHNTNNTSIPESQERNEFVSQEGDRNTNNNQQKNNTSTCTTTKTFLDTHLTVPFGSIKLGKFFYPKNHPSFFEQPMFQPVKQPGVFALQQILGSLNTAQNNKDGNEFIEKYKRSDFYNKTFLLTTNPIGHRIKKGNVRWSIKYNTYVSDQPSKKKNDNNDEKNIPVDNIRVMQIQFHANNTFSSTAGLGRDIILRGKFDIIGDKKDHLWFQVVRFGFGRSVSGSVYSEGRMLTQDDAKAYWGKIESISKDNSTEQQKKEDDITNQQVQPTTKKIEDSHQNPDEDSCISIEVNGSVFDGWGLEPIPVAQFIMREIKESNQDDMDDDEEEDDEDDNDTLNTRGLMGGMDVPGSIEGIDWSKNHEDTMFQ